jgi:hypothetical protein
MRAAQGNVNIGELRQKAEQNAANLAALMITYPSTHGVYEEGVDEICRIIHKHGGQVYMDGANMNAQVGGLERALVSVKSCGILLFLSLYRKLKVMKAFLNDFVCTCCIQCMSALSLSWAIVSGIA